MSTEQNNRTVKVCERCAGEEGSDRFTSDGKRYIVEFAKGRNVCRVCYNIARRVTKPPELFIRSVQLKIQRPEQPPQNSSPEQNNSSRTIDQNDRSERIHQLVTQMYSDMTASFSKIHISQVLETENTVLKDQIAELNNTIQQLKSDQINRSEQQNRTLIEQNEKLKHDYDAQLGSMFDQKEALDISKKQTDKLTEAFKHDLQLAEQKYSGQTGLLKVARDEVKALKEELQNEIQVRAQNQQEISQFRVELQKIKAEVLIHENTVNQVTLQLKEKDEQISTLQSEVEDKDQRIKLLQAQTRSLINEGHPPRPMTAPQTVNVGVVAGLAQRFEKLSPQSPPKGLPSHPNLAQIFNIKPDMPSGRTILEDIMAKNVRQIHLEAQKTSLPVKEEHPPSAVALRLLEETMSPNITARPLEGPERGSPCRPPSFKYQASPKTRECRECQRDLLPDQFVKWHQKCRECEN
jgi:hypothetical protein